MSPAPSILFVIDYFHGTGGTERHLAQLVRHLCDELFQVTVVVFDLGTNPLIDSMRKAGAQIVGLPVGRIYIPRAMLQAWRLFRLMRERRVEIVQTFHQKADTFGAIVAHLAGVNQIISSRRDNGMLKSRPYVIVSRLIRSWFDKVIVVSDSVARSVVRSEGMSPADIVKIYNGVDVGTMRPPSPEQVSSARKSLGFGPDDFVVGMVANFRPEKNHEVLFAAAVEAKRRIPKLKLLLVGGGPLLDRYRVQFEQSTDALGAVFTGAVDDVSWYLQAMDVACLISLEGFSNAVLEKMAMGLPMVVSNVGGNAEAIVDGRNGLLVPLNDAAALARALIALYRDPILRNAMARESRRLAEDLFSLERMKLAHMELYRSKMSGNGSVGKSRNLVLRGRGEVRR